MGKRYRAEEIVMKLREIELSINKGMDVVHAYRQAGISDHSYYRWQKKYSGMKVDPTEKTDFESCTKIYHTFCAQ